ncbi:MAG: tRNA lysidine(34) synthetase TilS [Kiritimatiellia bacterium]|jgi:tRNA(Ile)-lysidine synthase|nr:tRNA lysidine(34) synthetase TilS [Kiritimatiellia bacterium]
MLSKVHKFARHNGLLCPGDTVLVAVSGGADSVALLHCLAELSSSLEIRLTVAHLDHCIRGKAAQKDADFVSQQADALGLPHVAGKARVPALAKRMGISIEMAAREARYNFFARVAKETGATCVATAHTADDQAETVLLRLARGAGASGLGGIRAESAHHGIRVVHPMLQVTRSEVIAFLTKRKIEWREDLSNADDAFLRNRVRNEIMPILEEKLNPGMRDALCRSAEISSDENEWIDSIISDIYNDCTTGVAEQPGGGPVLSSSMLKARPKGARRRVIRLWLTKCGVPAERLGFDTVERVDALLSSRSGSGSFPVHGTCIVRREYDRLLWTDTEKMIAPSEFRQTITVPGETLLNGQGLRVVVTRETGVLKQKNAKAGVLPAWASINAVTVGRKRLRLRSWQSGDRIRPMGVPGSKKLQDVFVDAKVPASQRCRIPILECGGTIVWVPGYRVARGWEVPTPSSRAIHISINRI